MPIDGWLRTSQTAAMAFLCVFEDGDEPSAAAGLHIVHRLRVGCSSYVGGTSYVYLRSPDWISSFMTRSEQSICGCGYVPRYGTLCFDVVAIEISRQLGT